MNSRKLSDQALAAATALGELDVRPYDRVLIMLPDGPDFTEACTGVIQQRAVPLPVNPPLSAHHLVTIAAEAGARLVLATTDQMHALADLDTEPPLLINGPHGLWAAVLCLR